jgi:hypothetical protein
VCLETRTHGSEGGKSREGPTYLVWVTKLTLDASNICLE